MAVGAAYAVGDRGRPRLRQTDTRWWRRRDATRHCAVTIERYPASSLCHPRRGRATRHLGPRARPCTAKRASPRRNSAAHQVEHFVTRDRQGGRAVRCERRCGRDARDAGCLGARRVDHALFRRSHRIVTDAYDRLTSVAAIACPLITDAVEPALWAWSDPAPAIQQSARIVAEWIATGCRPTSAQTASSTHGRDDCHRTPDRIRADAPHFSGAAWLRRSASRRGLRCLAASIRCYSFVTATSCAARPRKLSFDSH